MNPIGWPGSGILNGANCSIYLEKFSMLFAGSGFRMPRRGFLPRYRCEFQ